MMETKDTTREETARLRYRTPNVEVFEDGQALWVSADLPGVAPGSVDVAIDHGVLTISAPIGTNGDTPATFRRRFTLAEPSRFDTEHVNAVFRHGVLELRLPKADRAKRRQIPVTVN
jgi:HSP20 family protein